MLLMTCMIGSKWNVMRWILLILGFELFGEKILSTLFAPEIGKKIKLLLLLFLTWIELALNAIITWNKWNKVKARIIKFTTLQSYVIRIMPTISMILENMSIRKFSKLDLIFLTLVSLVHVITLNTANFLGTKVCVFLDHFGVHYIPCYKQSLNEFKSLDGHGVLGVYFSGIHNATNKSNDYLIYNEPWSEDSNVNCYHLDRFLSSWLKDHPNCSELILVSDTCAKIRSNLLLALVDYRVRVQKCLGPNGNYYYY